MNPSSTPPAVPDSDLVSRTFGEPMWHADGDLLALAYAPDGTLWSVEEPGVLRHWESSGRLLGRYFLTHAFGGASAIMPKRADKSRSLDADWAIDYCATDDFLEAEEP